MQHMIPRLLLFKYETGSFSMNLMHRAKFDIYTISTLVLVDTMQRFQFEWTVYLVSIPPFPLCSLEQRKEAGWVTGRCRRLRRRGTGRQNH